MGSTAASISSIVLHGPWKEFGQWYCIPPERSNEIVHSRWIWWAIPMEPQSTAHYRTSRWPINSGRKWKHQPMAMWTTDQITHQCKFNVWNSFYFILNSVDNYQRLFFSLNMSSWYVIWKVSGKQSIVSTRVGHVWFVDATTKPFTWSTMHRIEE